MREICEGWLHSAATQEKKLERLKSFFRFCVDNGWLKSSPAAPLKPPRQTQRPKIPFSIEEMERIYAACDSFPIKGIYGEENRFRLKAMTLLLRYSGIRLGHRVILRRDRLRENKLFLYTQKTGTPVHLVLPPKVIEALAITPGGVRRQEEWENHQDESND